MGNLSGKVTFITGAGRGIGKAISELFAAEGAIIAAAARSEDEINTVCSKIKSRGGSAMPIVMDLQSEESIISAVSKAQSELGPIDILINNAAILTLSSIAETSTQAWDDIMSTNMRGLFITCREVLPAMMERKTGRIINIGSLAGRRGYPEQGAYCTSKHALVGFTKVLALETQSHGIRVNMLSPGGVLTDLSKNLRASRGESEDSPEWMTSEEVAQAALYLCNQIGAAVTDELVLRRHASGPWR